MSNNFVYAIKTKPLFCPYYVLYIVGFVYFVYCVHVFLKRHFLMYSLYELVKGFSVIPPAVLSSHVHGWPLYKIYKIYKTRFTPIMGCAA